VSDDTQIIFGSVVRIVSLTEDDNSNNETFKYRLVNLKNLSNRRLPDVLIIGVKKSGTRALLEFLRIHPNIRAAGSEIHFFDRRYSFGKVLLSICSELRLVTLIGSKQKV
jgi:hypothetical protein